MKKKIGIITLHQIINYGGILQALALQTVLERLGFEIEVIEKYMWPRQLSFAEKMMIYPARKIKRIIKHKNSSVRREEKAYKKAFEQYYVGASKTLPFVNKYIQHRYVYSFSELRSDDYYALVVGSDQIWRPCMVEAVNMTIKDAYLDFAKGWDVKRIAYAASFGVNDWEYSEAETDTCRLLIKKFDAVSCREESGMRFCKEKLSFPDAVTVLDPTMLLGRHDYDKLFADSPQIDKGELFCYILDDNEITQKVVDYIVQNKGWKRFDVIAKSNDVNAPIEDRTQPPVEDWLYSFKHAKFIVTDSYHACVFSIIYQKPFLLIANKDRGIARYETLLSTFGLEQRMIHEFDVEKIDDILAQQIVIDARLLSEKKDNAIKFLKDSLL